MTPEPSFFVSLTFFSLFFGTSLIFPEGELDFFFGEFLDLEVGVATPVAFGHDYRRIINYVNNLNDGLLTPLII